MKSLIQHLNERLLINKDYKEVNGDIEKIINKLFENTEYSDIEWDGTQDIKYKDVTADMIDVAFDGYSKTDRFRMYDKIITTFKFMPSKISTKNYKRAIRKIYVDIESEYADEITDLYKKLYNRATCTNHDFSIKNCNLIDDHVYSMIMNDMYMVIFLLNEKTNEMFELFIIEFK